MIQRAKNLEPLRLISSRLFFSFYDRLSLNRIPDRLAYPSAFSSLRSTEVGKSARGNEVSGTHQGRLADETLICVLRLITFR